MDHTYNLSSDLEEFSDVQKPVVRWYAVQVASGCEKRVKSNLEQRVQTLDTAGNILQIQIPKAPTIKVRKDGSRQQGEEKVFPGYILVKMIMDDDTWLVIKSTPNLSNFVGSEQRRASG